MRFLPTRVHGFLDYAVSLLLIALPWLFGFAEGGAETWVPVALGVGAIVYTLFTDHEWGVVRVIPMPVHLMLDAVHGIVLALSPWLFGFNDRVWAPHLAMGLLELAVTSVSQTTPSTRRRSVA